jgi:hypothetical protein
MINIFFVPGMFGSSLEFILRSYTNEYVPVIADIDEDGSMHSFKKEYHPQSVSEIDQFRDNLTDNSITTQIYPFQHAHLDKILELHDLDKPGTYNILIFADSTKSAELNLLFQYYKIAVGSNIRLGLDIFFSNNEHNIAQWNKNYSHWGQMEPWQLREWFSLFYVQWVQEWINSTEHVDSTFLKIKNTDILFDTKNICLKTIDFCNLTLSNDLDSFVNKWISKQQYIVTEFNLLDQIVEHTINNQEFSWSPICIISEAIVQQRLRNAGYEIKCDGLDTFPTNSKMLYSLLERC